MLQRVQSARRTRFYENRSMKQVQKTKNVQGYIRKPDVVVVMVVVISSSSSSSSSSRDNNNNSIQFL
jgi:hypothetical protein